MTVERFCSCLSCFLSSSGISSSLGSSSPSSGISSSSGSSSSGSSISSCFGISSSLGSSCSLSSSHVISRSINLLTLPAKIAKARHKSSCNSLLEFCPPEDSHTVARLLILEQHWQVVLLHLLAHSHGGKHGQRHNHNLCKQIGQVMQLAKTEHFTKNQHF